MSWNRTILVVDDEPETLKGYQEFLLNPASSDSVRKSSRVASPSLPEKKKAEEVYRVLSAPSGEEAIQLVKKEMSEGRRVAAGFFDVKLEGGIDGLQTIQEIKKLDSGLRCVVVTAYHDRSVDEINTLFGDDFKDHWDYLNKPFTRGEIVQKARQMIAAWNREQELLSAREWLIRSERLAGIGQVARGVGHEFGNILQRIMGKADIALGESDLASVKEHLKVVIQAAERAGVIARNLQSFSRSEPSLAPVRISVLIEDALSLMGHELKRSSIQVVKSFQGNDEASVDKVRIGQVLLNLIINASHAIQETSKDAGTIEIRVSPKSSEGKPGVGIEVRDSGTGIPAEVLPKIFEFAFTTKGEKGSGLGLSISKEIVEAHGGTIEASNDPEGGAIVALWLPSRGGGT